MNSKIKLGYEIGTGKEINIDPSHLIVTGLSQKSGKTTTLEALISRSKQRAIVFRTKVGEKSFLAGHTIPPYFKERSDWEFIQSLIESTMKIKVNWRESSKIKQICKKAISLSNFKEIVDEKLSNPKISGFDLDLYTNLQAYLEKVLPKLQTINFSDTLDLQEGLNIVNLERFSRDDEVQSLIILSIIDEVLYNHKDTIIVIPEAWKFIPQGRGNPCKLIVEQFIRQAATNNNFLWIDSQDITGVDKIPLKQITEWILGYQAEVNEVKHTIDQIPLPKDKKPKPDDIMTLGKGIFIYASRDLTTKVYVKPTWLDDARAKKVAIGELKIEDLDAPSSVIPEPVPIKIVENNDSKIDTQVKKDLNELRTDMFDNQENIQSQINDINTSIYNLKQEKSEIDEDTIIAKILQKLSKSNISNEINIQEIVDQVLNKIPKSSGSVTYDVLPLEKLKKDFLEECKQKILDDVSGLNEKEKKTLKYLESVSKAVTVNEIVTKCFFLKPGGSNDQGVRNALKTLESLDMDNTRNKGKHNAKLKEKIKSLLETHEATNDEIENLYQHILMEMI